MRHGKFDVPPMRHGRSREELASIALSIIVGWFLGLAFGVALAFLA